MTQEQEPQESDVEEHEETRQELEERIAHLTDSLARTQADYANFRRRTEERADAERKRAAQHLISDVLQVVDNLELAIRRSPQSERGDFHQGVELILGQLVTVLEEHGVSRIQTDSFDPQEHEALLTEPSDEPKGTILEVLQPGYRLGEVVLRTAKVKLSTGEQEKEQ